MLDFNFLLKMMSYKKTHTLVKEGLFSFLRQIIENISK